MVSQTQSVQNCNATGARKCGYASAVKRRKLTGAVLESARQRIANGETQKALAQELGISTACMSERIRNPYKEST